MISEQDNIRYSWVRNWLLEAMKVWASIGLSLIGVGVGLILCEHSHTGSAILSLGCGLVVGPVITFLDWLVAGSRIISRGPG